MTPAQATALLGIPDGELTADAVRGAFNRRVKEVHPDGGDPSVYGAAASEILSLKQARTLLLEQVENQNNACALCCGTGKVRGRIGTQGCSACEGTGERK